MNEKKKGLIIIGLVLLLLIVAASLLYKELGSKYAPEQMEIAAGDKVESEIPEDVAEAQQEGEAQEDLVLAPDFTVYDLEGNEAKLSDYFGKPMVLNFWASWCGPCRSEMADFDEAYNELGENVQFLMVNMTDGSRETVETAHDFVTEQGYSFPAFYDTDYSAAVAYGVYSLPSTYFIDAQGQAIARAAGAIDGETLQTGIDMIYTAE